MTLHNRINGKVLKSQLHSGVEDRITLSFYRYYHIDNPKAFRDELYATWDAMDIRGRIYVALEGINGQLSVPKVNFERFKDSIAGMAALNGIRLNVAIDDDGKSFFKLKILVRKKIVADGLNDELFDPSDGGIHLSASEFNDLSAKKGTVVVDMRNHYESEVGHFQGAICPDVDTFRESLPVVEKLLDGRQDENIIMYCTGGIRCEKASAWFKHKGFKKVHQLDGGIIEYARQVTAQGLENKFKGKNFVFDERLGERISDDVISFCHQCGKPSDHHTNCKNDACHLLFIQCPECAEKFNGCCSVECRDVLTLDPSKQKELRRGKSTGRMVYKKGRSGHLRKKEGSLRP